MAHQSLLQKFILSSCLIALFSFVSSDSDLPYTKQLSPKVTLNWDIDQKYGIITVELVVQSRGWVGFGWHCWNCPDSGMANADFSIGIFSNGVITVNDYFASPQNNGETQPVLDTSVKGYDNIISYSGSQTSTTTTMRFSKLLITNDTTADNRIIGDNTKVIFAFGNSNEFGYHGQNNKGEAIVNFFTSKQVSDKVDILRVTHGSLMFLCFAFCMTFGIFVSRYLKDFYWWFPLHIFVQVVGILCALAAFVVALVMVKSGHFSNIHSWFGLVVLCLSIVTPAVGWASHMVYNPSRSSTPIWPDIIHWWAGRLTVLLAYVTIFLGFRQYGANPALGGVFWGGVALFLIIYFSLDLYRYSNREDASHGEKTSLLKANKH